MSRQFTRREVVGLVLVFAIFAGLAALSWSCRKKPHLDSPGQLFARLHAADPDWQADTIPGALVLRRKGHPAPWPEVLELAKGPPSRFCAVPGRLLICRDQGVEQHPTEGELYLPPLLVRGHPDELQAVADALR